jgi:hypothetical protein
MARDESSRVIPSFRTWTRAKHPPFAPSVGAPHTVIRSNRLDVNGTVSFREARF